MITITISGLIIFILISATLVLGYLYYKEKLKVTQYMNGIESEMKEIEDLAAQKIERVDKTYEDVVKKLSAEIEFYQKYIMTLSSAITLTDNKLKELDAKGTFDSDDEIGFFFRSVRDIQKILNDFKVEEANRT